MSKVLFGRMVLLSVLLSTFLFVLNLGHAQKSPAVECNYQKAKPAGCADVYSFLDTVYSISPSQFNTNKERVGFIWSRHDTLYLVMVNKVYVFEFLHMYNHENWRQLEYKGHLVLIQDSPNVCCGNALEIETKEFFVQQQIRRRKLLNDPFVILTTYNPVVFIFSVTDKYLGWGRYFYDPLRAAIEGR